MKIQKKIEITLLQRPNSRKFIDVVQYDTGVQLVFTVADFDIPDGTTAMLYVQKKSGKFVYQETGITVSGNVITVELENQALTEYGHAGYQVQLVNGTDRISAFAGILRVEKSLADAGAEESKTVIAAFEAAISERVAAVVESNLEEIRTQIDDLNDGLKQTIIPSWTDGQFVLYSDGSVQTSSVYSLTDFIDVSRYSSVNVLTKVAGSAGVCLYDADKSYITGLQPDGLTEIDVSEASYLRVSCWKEEMDLDSVVIEADIIDGIESRVKSIEDKMAEMETESSTAEKDLYDSSLNTNRQYYDTSGALVTDVYGWYTTGDMDVTGKNSLTYGGLTNTASAANARSVFKDSDGGIISVFLPSTGENVLAVPDGAVSVAFTLHMNDIETFYVKVAEVTSTVNLAGEIVGGWYDKLGDRMKNLLSKATEKLICCIVDDDTVDAECVTLFKNACDANGIKGTLSTLTQNWAADSTLKDTLLDMEREGFQTVIHGYSQIAEYEDPENNLATCEDNLVQGMHDMESAGFLDYKYWVTPFCKDTEGIQSMARKWGMKCILAGGNTYEPADDTYGRYAIRRAAFGPNDTDGSITLAQLQTIAQEAAQNNGWLIVMTHFETWRDAGGDYTRFTELIDYLKGLGYEFMTVAEAWSYRKAIYDVYDMF